MFSIEIGSNAGGVTYRGPLPKREQKKKEQTQEGYCYLATNGDDFKIGFSAKPEVRIKQLQTGNQRPLRLINVVHSDRARTLEQVWHFRLSSYRRKGEWFTLPPRIARIVIQSFEDGTIPKLSPRHTKDKKGKSIEWQGLISRHTCGGRGYVNGWCFKCKRAFPHGSEQQDELEDLDTSVNLDIET